MPAQGTALGIGSGVENSNALKGQNRFVSRILFRPFRAGRILIRIGSPGRCPGLSCFGPFGAAEKAQLQNLRRGVRGGGARHDQSQGLPMLSPSQSFRIPLARREESFSISKAPAPPPPPPLRKGGKGIARSRRHSIARNKNTRLETVPPARSTPTFHRPSGGRLGAMLGGLEHRRALWGLELLTRCADGPR